MDSVWIILASVALGVVGQLVIKSGVGVATTSTGRAGIGLLVGIVTNRAVIAGLGIYAIGTLFWLVALSRVELSYAYPFISLSYVLVLLASWALFGERVSALRVFGVLAICLGVYAVAGG